MSEHKHKHKDLGSPHKMFSLESLRFDSPSEEEVPQIKSADVTSAVPPNVDLPSDYLPDTQDDGNWWNNLFQSRTDRNRREQKARFGGGH